MALLTTQSLMLGGLAPTLSTASAGGDTWQPSSTTFLLFENSGGSACTATIVVTATSYGQAVDNVTVTVPSGGFILAGPFEPGMVAAASTGLASVTYSSVTGLTVAVLSTD